MAHRNMLLLISFAYDVILNLASLDLLKTIRVLCFWSIFLRIASRVILILISVALDFCYDMMRNLASLGLKYLSLFPWPQLEFSF